MVVRLLSPDAVTDAIRNAASAPMVSVAGVEEFMAGGGLMRMVVNCGRSPLSYLGGVSRWLCVAAEVSESSVIAEMKVIDDSGAPDSIGANFAEIDTDFLRFVPADAAVIVAFGKFDGNVRALSMLLGRFMPVYMRGSDGTTALFAVPEADVRAVAGHSPGAWHVETVTHVPAEMVDSCLGLYRETAGAIVAKLDGHQFSFSQSYIVA